MNALPTGRARAVLLTRAAGWLLGLGAAGAMLSPAWGGAGSVRWP
jgi:hypothetical protein